MLLRLLCFFACIHEQFILIVMIDVLGSSCRGEAGKRGGRCSHSCLLLLLVYTTSMVQHLFVHFHLHRWSSL